MGAEEELKAAFSRYLNNRYSTTDLLLIQRHFEQESSRELLCQLILAELGQSEGATDTAAIDRMLANTDARVASALQQHPRRKKISLYRRLYFILPAAAVLITAIGYPLALLLQPAPVKMHTLTVGYGRYKRIILADSTLVWLNAGSTLEYPETFANSKTRSVKLKSGQAFFQVKHQSSQPFIVHVNQTDVTVLGTSFEIIAGEKENSVVVKTGRIGLLAGQRRQPAFLTAGKRGIVNKASGLVRTTIIDTADIAAWRSGRLIFSDELMADVLHRLEFTYHVEIIVTNEQILKERVSMRLNHQPLDNVLTAISFANHFTFKRINENSVVVK